MEKKEIEIIVTWLGHTPNFQSIFGSQHTTIGNKNKPKSHGYQILAEFLKKRTKGEMDLSAKAIKERLNRHLKKYRETKQASEKTGFGVTSEDYAKGIFTNEDKLESLCYCYERIDKLFGERPNIKPLHTHSSSGVEDILSRNHVDNMDRIHDSPHRHPIQANVAGEEVGICEGKERREEEREEGEEEPLVDRRQTYQKDISNNVKITGNNIDMYEINNTKTINRVESWADDLIERRQHQDIDQDEGQDHKQDQSQNENVSLEIPDDDEFDQSFDTVGLTRRNKSKTARS